MKKIKGFTLIELLVVIAIIGIITSIIFSATTKAHACGSGWFESACDSNSEQVKDLRSNQERMVQAVPMPILSNSLERQNVAKRATLFDKPDKISYIYLVSYGKVMAFYTVKGKVSSLNSFLSPQEQIVNGDGSKCWMGDGSCYTTSAPDMDGTYGSNTEGIFFFTTEGAYVEWSGEYMMSDQPLQLSTQPELIRKIK